MGATATWLALGLMVAALLAAGVVYRLVGLVYAGSAGTAARPAATAMASTAGVQVTIYTTAYCPYCKKAKAFFQQRGVAYEERDVESSRANAVEARKLTGSSGVPVITIDGEVIAGFNPQVMASTLERATKRRAGG